MSDKFYRIPFGKLARWVFTEESEKGSIFGIYKENFFEAKKSDVFWMERYGEILETPIGVAAGPHTQLAQNIIASWLCGARYIELKTVQTLDEIEVTKPCIEIEDEGYNCEWSQELKIEDSFDEYLNAWVLIHVLKHKFGRDSQNSGFIFNMSVGYGLKGILLPNVQWFLDKMNYCGEELEQKISEIEKYYPRVREIKIPSRISDNVTLSTMHGCPPGEIENICRYLITDRKLHTTLKLNPTLLGKKMLSDILNIKLGYGINVPDEAFEHDLKYEDALNIINSLRENARSSGVEFGLKLTNTLESLNSTRWLPKKEKMVYTSGRALHPISVNLARKLQNDFGGTLDISFSAGIDCFNAPASLACNLKPLTVCSDLLKPGGYTRLNQYIIEIESEILKTGQNNISEFIKSKGEDDDLSKAGLNNLDRYADSVASDKYYNKSNFPYDNIKTKRHLTEYDCIHAPCIEACAVDQNVPEYMYYTAIREYDNAYKAVIRNNPLPNMTGNVCDHLCQTKCTRMNYDNPLLIRGIKRFIAEKAENTGITKAHNAISKKAAVIGAGPSGLTCAYFLAGSGMQVDLFESRQFAGGMVSGQIPFFRLSDESVSSDIEIIRSAGVRLHFGTQVDKQFFTKIRGEYDFIYIGIGAQTGKKLNISGEESEAVLDQLSFLEKVRSGSEMNIGKNVAVIGGGLSAIDAARTALRLTGKGGRVIMIYRRTKAEMPAGMDEISAMLEEGVSLLELTAPLSIKEIPNNKLALSCIKMRLGETDAGGRPRPVPVEGSQHDLFFDNLITAIGQDVRLDFLSADEFRLKPGSFETNVPGIFAGGDAIRGADSLINAMGDGKKAAEEILQKSGLAEGNYLPAKNKIPDRAAHQRKMGRRVFGKELPEIPLQERDGFELVHPVLDEESAVEEAGRCLYCDDICNICVNVCPNFAIINYEAVPERIPVYTAEKTGNKINIFADHYFDIGQYEQILILSNFCNECGNCNTFCPTSGAPYKTKPHFYLTEESFSAEQTGFFIKDNTIYFKDNGEFHTLTVKNDIIEYSNRDLSATFDSVGFTLQNVFFSNTEIESCSFSKAAEMYFLLKNAGNLPVLSVN